MPCHPTTKQPTTPHNNTLKYTDMHTDMHKARLCPSAITYVIENFFSFASPSCPHLAR